MSFTVKFNKINFI